MLKNADRGCRLLTNSFDLLVTARELRRDGLIPSHVGIWAAENPVLECDASRLEAKISAGAETVLTQPPLAWERFEGWMDDARQRGATSAADIIVGMPLLTSPGTLRFWIQLCNAPVHGEQAALLEDWERAHRSMPSAEFEAFALDWNRQLAHKVRTA